MLDTRRPSRSPGTSTTTTTTTLVVRGPRSRLELELRSLADDMAGRVDRDELTRQDEELLTDLLDEAVAAALPAVLEELDRELTPRLESLPLNTRLVLARARRRLEFGLD
jgi:hypothetical protein